MSDDWKVGFEEITGKTHTEQGIWWLNGFWNDGASEYAEEIWTFTQLMIELDLGTTVKFKGKKGKELGEKKEGCDIDEFKSHQFLEKLGETLTVVALRKRLKTLDIDNNKRLALSEYLLNKYDKTPDQLVNSPQGDNEAEMKEAQQKVATVQAALSDVQDALVEQKAALATAADEAKKAAAALVLSTEAKEAADSALAAQKEAEALVKAAEAESQASLDALHKIEAEFKAKCDQFKDVAENGPSAMKKARARNELQQMLAADPLPLRKAKITQAAALKRVKVESKKAATATAAANDKAEVAAAALVDSEAAAKASAEAKEACAVKTKQVEDDVAATELAMQEALAFLQKVKSSGGGVANGAIWFMEREIAEAKKYMPQSRR